MDEATRDSWDFATREHNATKGDQAQFLTSGGDTLFDEELALLGDIGELRVLHLQCNSGQDSLCLARRGADVKGVDFSGEAVAFAQRLSTETGIAASFEQAEVIDWLSQTHERFDVVFASYGVLCWHRDLRPWFDGVARVLNQGGALVLVEFHPLVGSLGRDGRLSGDDYFHATVFEEPVGNYVADSGAALLQARSAPTELNPHLAKSYQHSLASIVSKLTASGLRLERFEEWPWCNGWRAVPAMAREGRRWRLPAPIAQVPLMFGLRARRDTLVR